MEKKVRRLKLVALLVLTCIGFLGVSLIDYALPVRYVWFGNQESIQNYGVSTVGHWNERISEWDWVGSYRLQWLFPHFLVLNITPKGAVARRNMNEYFDEEGNAFHLVSSIRDLPRLQVKDEELKKAIALLQSLQHTQEVSIIESHPSGSVQSKLGSGDQLIFPSFDYQEHWQTTLSQAKHKFNEPIICDFRQSKYVACYKASD